MLTHNCSTYFNYFISYYIIISFLLYIFWILEYQYLCVEVVSWCCYDLFPLKYVQKHSDKCQYSRNNLIISIIYTEYSTGTGLVVVSRMATFLTYSLAHQKSHVSMNNWKCVLNFLWSFEWVEIGLRGPLSECKLCKDRDLPDHSILFT